MLILLDTRNIKLTERTGQKNKKIIYKYIIIELCQPCRQRGVSLLRKYGFKNYK